MSSVAVECQVLRRGLAGLTVLADGSREWRGADGALHRAGAPARVGADGAREFWQHGRRDRDDGPAVERLLYPGVFEGLGWLPAEGPPILRLEFWRYGVLHRDDGPALVDGAVREWFRAGLRHRDDGPALVARGLREWWCDGLLHRADGPAIVHPDGTLEFYIAGERHREDGPAVEHADGALEWWLHGQRWEPVDEPRPGRGVRRRRAGCP